MHETNLRHHAIMVYMAVLRGFVPCRAGVDVEDAFHLQKHIELRLSVVLVSVVAMVAEGRGTAQDQKILSKVSARDLF